MRSSTSSARLGDVYYAAKTKGVARLANFIRERFRVDSERLPEFYATWFRFPWVRCYTLNIDDLEQAVSRRFDLPRSLTSISATDPTVQGTSSGSLEIVHLNGIAWGDIESVTFADADYAARLTRPDQWLDRCAAYILSRPVVFVGTELNESTLWQYVQYRKERGQRGARELRPGSYLVCPTLNPARRVVLSELNIDWIQMTAGEFEASVLRELESSSTEGHRVLAAKQQFDIRRTRPHLVSTLAAIAPTAPTEYLMGQEPTWADLQTGRAIERECDATLHELAGASLASDKPSRPLIVTGTAGSGKSTSLRRLALRISAQGTPVYWIDEESNIEPHSLRTLALETEEPIAIFVDDADLFGGIASGWARELPTIRPHVLFAAAIRSTRIQDVFGSIGLGDIEIDELSMPPLADPDIEALLSVLDANNRLGVLKGLSQEERVTAFRQEAGRQLLVAMIQATSGQRFRAKVFDEFQELKDIQRLLYAIVCLVSSQRYSIDRDEVLLASGEAENVTLNALEALVNRHIIVRESAHTGYKARHRVIAEEIVNAMHQRELMAPVLEGICFAFATQVRQDIARSDRRWRRLIRFMNHEFLQRLTTIGAARQVYERIEQLLQWDFHYWLQRGSLEVEAGDIALAQNFLDQARSLAPDDRNVRTEYGYLLMKKASQDPDNINAPEWFKGGMESIEDLIWEFGKRDSYPYHVLGSQGLAWCSRGHLSRDEKRLLLGGLLERVEQGRRNHPRANELLELEKDLKRAWLETAVLVD